VDDDDDDDDEKQIILLLRRGFQEGAFRKEVGSGSVAQEFCRRQYILGRSACQESISIFIRRP
jgi:hypothetical protein